MKEWTTKSRNVKSNTPAIPDGISDCSTENSQENASSDSVQPPLPRLDLPESDFSENREESHADSLCTDDTAQEPDAQMNRTHHMHQGHTSQHMKTLGSQPSHLVISICKDTIAPRSVDYQLANVELYTYFIVF